VEQYQRGFSHRGNLSTPKPTFSASSSALGDEGHRNPRAGIARAFGAYQVKLTHYPKPMLVEGAEPLMVRVVENGGRALGAEMGELKNVKE
jgi:hypothetical protein